MTYFWPQLGAGRVLYWGDIGLYFTPMAGFLHDNLRAGRIPLWNPWIYCGTPYVGNPQVWPLYPATALLPWVSAPYFFNLTVALHVWLAGLGTYVFARQTLMVGRVAALLAAITFMFGGQLVSKEQFPNMVQASAYLPWVLWALDRLLTRRRVWDALTLGLVLGLQLLAAHPQMTLLTLYLAAAWGVVVVREPAAARSRRTTGFLLLLSFTVASDLAAGQLLPTLALFQDAARQKLSFAVVNRFYLPPNQLGNFLLPRLHGQPFFGDWTARGNFWETCCYVGVLPFALALWGAFRAWRGGRQGEVARLPRFWTGVLAVSVGLAMGGKYGLYHLAYFVLPGFRAFHDPARCLLPACFALALLAAWGWGQVPPALGRLGPLLLLLAFTDLAVFGRTLYPLASPADLFPDAPNIAAVQADPDIRAGQARTLAPSSGVWLRFTNPKEYRQSVPGYQAQWADTLTPNLLMPYGLKDAYGYEPVALKTAQDTDGEAAHGFDPKATFEERAAAARRAGALGVKYVAVCRTLPPEASLSGLAAVRAAPTLRLPGRGQEPQAFVYLSRNTRWQPRARLDGASGPVTLTDDGPDRVSVSCTTSAPARLILADTNAAGWRAMVDGQAAPIETYGGSLRAVRLPSAGPHRVVFTYQPMPYRLGLYLSLLTLAGLIGAASCAGARKMAGRGGFGATRVE